MTPDLPDPLPIEPLMAPLVGVARIPGSKSITNRALICAALASGTSTLDGVLFADDTEAMLDCLTRLGIDIEIDRQAHRVRVTGKPMPSEIAPRQRREPWRARRPYVPAAEASLDARLSGTTARFVLPLLVLADGTFRVDGAEPLRARPMQATLDALRELGADVVALGVPDHLPVEVRTEGCYRRGPFEVTVPAAASSQFASGLLMVGPMIESGLVVELAGTVVSRSYVDMTASVMGSFGVTVWRDEDDANRYGAPDSEYRSRTYAIEPDASAASYFFAAAAITGGRVRIDGLGTDSLQGDLAFEQMGAEVVQGTDFTEVRGTGTLHGITVDMSDLSDTAQTLAAVAVFADSPTEVIGIGFIRRKETDRIAAVVTELRRCRIQADETDDGFRIEPGIPQPATIETYDDHRMAMSFALLGLRVPGIEIADPGCVAKTFPGYWDEFDRLRGEDG
jgi:3-phosphoshikimate 1-carboxyvinyltransferase